MRRPPALLLLACLFPALVARGQGASDLIATGGTVTRDAAGQDLAYLRWSAEDTSVLEGRAFAIWSRPGPAAANGPVTRRAFVDPATDPAAAQAALTWASRLGQTATELDSVLEGLAANLGVASGRPLADRLAALVRGRSRSDLRPMIPALASTHVAVALALGRAWAGPLDPGETTFEVHVADGTPSAAIVGRMTVAAGQPALLPAPGPVVQVPDPSPRGDLNIRLRWATPPELRRRFALSQGFNVWRLSAADARAAGWDARPPTLAEWTAFVAAGKLRRVNVGPVLVDRFFDDASVANFVADSEGSVTDDHERFEAGGTPFEDGSEWAYVVAARDLLGREGVLSPVGFARACHTLGPAAPGGLQLSNAGDWTAAAGASQALRLTWANPPPGSSDAPAWYELFRGTDLSEVQARGAPLPGNFVARVALPAGDLAEFIDHTLQPEVAFTGRTLWYAVRAVREGPCGAVPGPLSAPVLGGLREHRAPEAPTGGLDLNCPRPLVRYVEAGPEFAEVADSTRLYRLECTRRDDGIDWVEFEIVDGTGVAVFQSGRQAFGMRTNGMSFDAPVSIDVGGVEVRCRAGSVEGVESAWVPIRPTPRGNVWALRFEAAELGMLDLDPGDPLALLALQGPYGLEVVSTDSGGTLVLRTPAAEGASLLIQRGSGNEPWNTLGIATISESRVVVHEPRLRSGEDVRRLQYRGFLVIPRYQEQGTPTADCTHLARPAGSDTIRPVTVTLQPPDRAREYRLYRRTGDGPLSLIAQGPVPVFPPALPAAARRVVRHDDVLPDAAVELCYFGQVLDEHGNASALTPLGCVTVRPRSLPAPVLARPTVAGTVADPQVKLRWFCPPSGVRQFEVALVPRAGTNRLDPGLSARFAGLPLNRPVTRRPESVIHAAAVLALMRDRVVTPPVGSAELGAGPQFEATFRIVEGTDYDVFITALGPTAGAAQLRSLPSGSHRFQWKQPPPGPADPADELVPWPARPLPPVTRFNPAVQLVWLTATNLVWPTNLSSGAVGVVIGRLPPPNTDSVGTTYAMGWAPPAPVGYYDPNRALIRESDNERGGRPGSLLPAVLYRQQVTNRLHAEVSGDVIQVSPLIREIQWAETVLRDRSLLQLTDPFTAVARSEAELFVGGAVGRETRRRLCLLDTHPVVTGARYRYSLVRFRTDGEIAGTIALGELEVP